MFHQQLSTPRELLLLDFSLLSLQQLLYNYCRGPFQQVNVSKSYRNIKAKTTASFLMTKVFCYHGFPQVLLSNNGSNFNAKVITALVEQLGIHQDFTPPYNQLTNGTVKRANTFIVNILRKIATSNYQNWDLYIPAALSDYRLSAHWITRGSPFAMIYGREAMMPLLMFPPLMAQDESIDP